MMEILIQYNVISIVVGIILGFALRRFTRFPSGWIGFSLCFATTIGSTFVDQSWAFVTPWFRLNWMLFGICAYLTMVFLFSQLKEEQKIASTPHVKRRRRAVSH